MRAGFVGVKGGRGKDEVEEEERKWPKRQAPHLGRTSNTKVYLCRPQNPILYCRLQHSHLTRMIHPPPLNLKSSLRQQRRRARIAFHNLCIKPDEDTKSRKSPLRKSWHDLGHDGTAPVGFGEPVAELCSAEVDVCLVLGR